MLKYNGFKNIKAIPIKDIGEDSEKFVFEVEQIVINGVSFFEIGDHFMETSEIIITYHEKKEIHFFFPMKFFKKKSYITVGDHLQNMGFSSIYERKITDLITGWIVKDSSVEKILVNIEGQELPIEKDQSYAFDTKIIIAYHTFPR